MKKAHDDGIYYLCEIASSPTTRLFLQQSNIKAENKLVIKHLVLNQNTTQDTGKTAETLKTQDITLVQYDALEELVTKPISEKYALGCHLYPVPGSFKYRIFLSWFKQHQLPAVEHNQYILPIPKHESMLNTTIIIGANDQIECGTS